MTSHVRSNLDNALHRHNGDDGALSFDPFGSIVSVSSTCLSPPQKYPPAQNIGGCDGQRDKYLPVHARNTPKSVPTIPIAHRHYPAVSYLELC